MSKELDAVARKASEYEEFRDFVLDLMTNHRVVIRYEDPNFVFIVEKASGLKAETKSFGTDLDPFYVAIVVLDKGKMN